MEKNQNYKILEHIQDHTAIYSEIPFSKEEQKTFLNKNYLLLDNSKDQPILAYNNPYYGRINPLTGEANTKYTKETKPLYTLLWKLLLNQPSTVAFRYFSFTENITRAQSIKDFTQYCLTHGIRVQLQDLTVDYKTTLAPVQLTGNMQSAYWDNLNNQLKDYNKLLKESQQLTRYETWKPIYLENWLSPKDPQQGKLKAEQLHEYINTWLPAYELDKNYPDTEPYTYQIRHKGNPYKGIPVSVTTHKDHLSELPAYELDENYPDPDPHTDPIYHKGNRYKGIPASVTTHKDHLSDPKYHTFKIIMTYNVLKYYEQIGEPITNPNMLICETCGNPISTTDQTPIAQTSIYYELLGNSGYYLEPAPQITCPHCDTEYIYSIEDDDYFKTEPMKDSLIYTSKLSGKTYHWRNDPIPETKPIIGPEIKFNKPAPQQTTKDYRVPDMLRPTKIIIPNFDYFMEYLNAYQELHPEVPLQDAIQATQKLYTVKPQVISA